MVKFETRVNNTYPLSIIESDDSIICYLYSDVFCILIRKIVKKGGMKTLPIIIAASKESTSTSETD